MPRHSPLAARLGALAALFLLVLVHATAQAQAFPELTGRVVDAANIIPADREQALAQELADLETQSQRQFVVATIPDLQGYDIADYGYRLGRHWGIGDKERNDGVLLIVAPNERKMRIEVGYGLEPVLTDGLSSLIIEQTIKPHFKAGAYPGGIEAGAARIIEQLTLPPEEAEAIAQQAGVPAYEGIGPGLFDLIFFFFFLFPFIVPIALAFRRGRRRYTIGGVPVIVWSSPSWGSGRSSAFSSGSSGGFLGGGGSFGGGGASGSW